MEKITNMVNNLVSLASLISPFAIRYLSKGDSIVESKKSFIIPYYRDVEVVQKLYKITIRWSIIILIMAIAVAVGNFSLELPIKIIQDFNTAEPWVKDMLQKAERNSWICIAIFVGVNLIVGFFCCEKESWILNETIKREYRLAWLTIGINIIWGVILVIGLLVVACSNYIASDILVGLFTAIMSSFVVKCSLVLYVGGYVSIRKKLPVEEMKISRDAKLLPKKADDAYIDGGKQIVVIEKKSYIKYISLDTESNIKLEYKLDKKTNMKEKRKMKKLKKKS